MTYDLVNVFKEYFKDNKVVLDTYKMTDGYYYLIKKDGSFEKLKVNKNDSDNYELYEYLKIRDFYSKYLNSHKAIDTTYTEIKEKQKYTMAKKIYSNNIYTLFFKNKNIIGLCGEQLEKDAVPVQVFKKGINKYYESLQKLGSKKEEKELLKEFYKDDEIGNYKAKMLEAFDKIYEDLIGEEQKETFIKIYLDETEQEYERVGNIYFILKLFNTNDNNNKLNNEVYGVNNYNYGLNSKKPYLKLKTTPYKIGSLISREEIKIVNKLYIWLYNNGISENVLKLPTDWEFRGIPQEKEDVKNKDLYIIKIANNSGVARIDDFQYVTNFSTKIREFVCKDYINKEEKIFKTENIYELEWYTNNIWIAENKDCKKNYLRDSYYDYESKIAKSIISNWKKELLINYSIFFLDLFQKGKERNFVINLDKIATQIIENIMIEQFEKGKNYKYAAINAINLWIAYKEYFSKKGVSLEMKINNIQKECLEIFVKNEQIETDEQYYYLAGQVAFYLLNQSKASKLTQDITEPLIKATNLKRLKEELKYLYEKYNYDIYLNNPKFNNILSQLLLKEPETSVKENKYIILAGMLANNLFYTKKELENGGNEDGKNE